MKITRPGQTPSAPGPADWFTGQVRIDALAAAEAPGTAAANLVTFEPGARTNWHTHPAGQILIVTSGAGLCGTEGGPVEQISAGDVVWFPAGEKHWHGAAPDTAMSHIAVQEAVDGSPVTWLEPVAEADYTP